MKILIVQPDIRAYRADLFNHLMDFSSELLVVHSGVDESEGRSGFKKIYLKPYSVFNVKFIFGVLPYVKLYDVVVAGLDVHWPISFFYTFLSKKNKVVFWGHGYGKSKVANFIKKRAINKSRATIFYSHSAAQVAIKSGCDEKKLFVAPNTMWISNSEDLSCEKKQSFIYVGRLQKRKNIDTLIKAFSYAKKSLPRSIKLVIIGDGDVKQSLLDLVNDLSMTEDVLFKCGTTNENELKEHFQSAFAYVSPGAVGLGVLHSFSYGIPVVTTNVLGHGPEKEWIRNGVNGLVVEPTIISLADSMLELYQRPDYCSRLGASAYITYRDEASPTKMVEGFLQAVSNNK